MIAAGAIRLDLDATIGVYLCAESGVILAALVAIGEDFVAVVFADVLRDDLAQFVVIDVQVLALRRNDPVAYLGCIRRHVSRLSLMLAPRERPTFVPVV